MAINQLTHTQKKFLSLTLAVALVAITSMLTGCGNKQAEQAAAQQKATNEAAATFMKQGSGHVRKWGESGFQGFGPDVKPASSTPSTKNQGVDDAKK